MDLSSRNNSESLLGSGSELDNDQKYNNIPKGSIYDRKSTVRAQLPLDENLESVQQKERSLTFQKRQQFSHNRLEILKDFQSITTHNKLQPRPSELSQIAEDENERVRESFDLVDKQGRQRYSELQEQVMRRDIQLSQDAQDANAEEDANGTQKNSRNHSINSEVADASEEGDEAKGDQEPEYIPLDTEIVRNPDQDDDNLDLHLDDFEAELDDSDDGFSQILVEPLGFKKKVNSIFSTSRRLKSMIKLDDEDHSVAEAVDVDLADLDFNKSDNNLRNTYIEGNTPQLETFVTAEGPNGIIAST